MNTSYFISDQLINGIGTTLIHTLWQGLLIAILLYIILYLLPRKSAQLKYWLSVTALCAIVVWSGNTFSQYAFQPTELQFDDKMGKSSITLVAGELSGMYHTFSFNSLLGQLAAKVEPYNNTLVTAWVIGMIFFLLRLQGSMIYLQRLRTTGIQPVSIAWQRKIEEMSQQMGIQSSIKIVESRIAEIPMVVGHLKPMILLPIGMLTGLQTHEVEAILAHELAHIKRFDYLINIAQTVVESVLFFNPAVWWISQTIRKQREHCCDDIAVKCCGNQLVYANALTNLGEWALRTPTLGMGLFKNKNELLMRIKRLVYPQMGSRTVKEKLVPGIVLFLTVLCLSWYSHKVQAEMMSLEPQVISTKSVLLLQQVNDTVPSTPDIEETEELPSMLPPSPDIPVPIEEEIEIDQEVDINIEREFEINVEVPIEEVFVFPDMAEFDLLSELPSPEVFADIDKMVGLDGLVDLEQMEMIMKGIKFQWNDTTRERIREALEKHRETLERARIEQAEALEKARDQLRQSLEAERPNDLTEQEWIMAKEQIRQAERSVERAMRQSERALEQALQEHEFELHEQLHQARKHMDHQALVHKHIERIEGDKRQIHRNVQRIHRDVARHGNREQFRHNGKESRLRSLLFEDDLIDDYSSSFTLEFKKDQIKVNGIRLGGDQKEKYRKFLDEVYGENSTGSLTYSD